MLSTMPVWCIVSPITRNLELILLTQLNSNISYTAALLLTVLLAYRIVTSHFTYMYTYTRSNIIMVIIVKVFMVFTPTGYNSIAVTRDWEAEAEGFKGTCHVLNRHLVLLSK